MTLHPLLPEHLHQGITFAVFGLTASTGSTEHFQEPQPLELVKAGLHPQRPFVMLGSLRPHLF
jgi:hypothetical protein